MWPEQLLTPRVHVPATEESKAPADLATGSHIHHRNAPPAVLPAPAGNPPPPSEEEEEEEENERRTKKYEEQWEMWRAG
jgi:hypothetical protein